MSQRILAVRLCPAGFSGFSHLIGVFFVGAKLETAKCYHLISSRHFKMSFSIYCSRLGDSNGFIQFCCDFDSRAQFAAWSMGKQQGTGTTHAGAACEEPCWIGSSKRRRAWRMMPTWISQAIKFWETAAGVNKNKLERRQWEVSGVALSRE